MNSAPSPDPERLDAARASVQTFLKKKKRWTTAMFVIAGCAEMTFFILMLLFMDFESSLNWFILCGFCMVYMPLIIFTWRNAIMIDRLYYRLVADLKFGDSQWGPS